jgi:hypothetical protein
MTVVEFNDQVNTSLSRLRHQPGAAVRTEQERLRRLAGHLESEDDQAWAERMIEELPGRVDRPPRSAWMAEAQQLESEAVFGGGSVDERIAKLAATRRRILTLAEQAPREEQAAIVGLTRTLEHLEMGLRDPFT